MTVIDFDAIRSQIPSEIPPREIPEGMPVITVRVVRANGDETIHRLTLGWATVFSCPDCVVQVIADKMPEDTAAGTYFKVLIENDDKPKGQKD